MGLAQLGNVEINANVDAEAELDALVAELCEPPLDDVLLDLEVRDAEPDQAAAGLVALEDSHRVTRTVELLSARESRRAGADDRDALPRPGLGRLRDDPALVPRTRHDGQLDLLDGDGVALLDLEHAGRLARCRTEAPGELGEVVGAVQLGDRLAPAIAVDEVVPVRDEVSERTAVMTERHATLHATRALLPELHERQLADELEMVAD